MMQKTAQKTWKEKENRNSTATMTGKSRHLSARKMYSEVLKFHVNFKTMSELNNLNQIE